MAPERELARTFPSMDRPFDSFTTLSSNSTSDLNSVAAFSSRILYAESFDRPLSSTSFHSGQFRKNIKQMTGFTTTEDEFDALPIAVRRKYFSTLERLRFAQNSTSNALNDLPIQRTRKGSIAERRGVITPVIDPPRKNISHSIRRLRRSRQSSVSSNEASWFLTLPEKRRKKQFTREEQVVLAGRLRESVILDAADEAIYKASRRASRNLTPLSDATPSTGTYNSSQTEGEKEHSMAEVMYESFRWMDEESDLDLKLVLDDYHANLDGVKIPTPNSIRRPSFRRQMSITKMPFGRSSFASLQPRSPKFNTDVNAEKGHNRQKSRTLSLIAPKHSHGHGVHDSISSMDPNATHYQDPEARLKLRVYLASPQKFDEAIEFGFPSMDSVTTQDDKENLPPRLSPGGQGKRMQSTDKGHSFLLNDIDTASLFEDDASMLDPDPPLTPVEKESGFYTHSHHRSPTSLSGWREKDGEGSASAEYAHLGIMRPVPREHKQQESYAQSMAGSREMTLRMTLTRPDLRADENTLYGWQNAHLTKSPPRDEPLLDAEGRDDMRGPFGGVDGWEPYERDVGDPGVVKRFWNRVKSSQRKAS